MRIRIKFHYIYKITNLINGMYYIGAHSTNNIMDNYMGSGVLIRLAIEHYGKHNFEMVIIKNCISTKNKWYWERRIITRAIIKDPQCYNLITGGKRKSKNTFKVNAKTKNCKELLTKRRIKWNKKH